MSHRKLAIVSDYLSCLTVNWQSYLITYHVSS